MSLFPEILFVYTAIMRSVQLCNCLGNYIHPIYLEPDVLVFGLTG